MRLLLFCMIVVTLLFTPVQREEEETMRFSELLDKVGSGESLTPQEKLELVTQAKRIEEVASLVTSITQPGTKNLNIDGMTANSARINNAVITNAIIESATAGDGHVILSDHGIDIIEGGAAYIVFYDDDGTTRRAQISTNTGGIQLQSVIAGESFDFFIKTTDTATPYIQWKQDPDQENRTRLEIQPGVQGARLGVMGNMGTGNVHLIDFRTQGSSGGSTFMRMRETTTTPPNPSGSLDAYHMYMKGDKLIIQAASNKYFYLDLTATTDQSWIYSSTAP